MGLFSKPQAKKKIGLILGGGGARAAYQVGVLKAISEIYPESDEQPFRIITGTSAGSINAIGLAGNSGTFKANVDKVVSVWENFQLHHVFKSDAACLIRQMLKWLAATLLPFGWGGETPDSLLDNSPLRELLTKHVEFGHINTAIEQGKLDAVCVNATSYATGKSVSFFQAKPEVSEWKRAFRYGQRGDIDVDKLMASSAIPAIFPSVKIDNEYFGDGSMRQNTPISPAIHLGAEKILVIGVRQKSNSPTPTPAKEAQRPSISQISGYIMDTLFLNSMDADIERLERINALNDQIPEKNRQYKNIAHLTISPTEDIAEIAHELFYTFPKGFRIALKILGLHKGNSRRLTSYLMFNKEFCQKLTEMGYQDAHNKKQELENFLELEKTS